MDLIPGTPFSGLTVEDLEAFLSTAGGEPLTWEAKADHDKSQLRPETVRRELCGFANSELGGHLILGAARQSDAWMLPGLRNNPPADLPVWVSQIADGIDPRPDVDVRDWPARADRGLVGVVMIRPVAEPPALVSDGTIYHRVAGATRPVTDGRLLAELFGRGEAARLRTEAAATDAISSLGMGPSSYGVFAFATTGGPRGFESPLFTRPVVDLMKRAVLRTLDDGRISEPNEVAIRQESVVAVAKSLGSGPTVSLSAARSGAVCLKWQAEPNTSGSAASVVITNEWSRVAWEAAIDVLSALGARGRLRIAIHVNPELRSSPVRSRHVAFEDWVAFGPPDSAELALIHRELRRGDQQGVLDDDVS